MSLYFDEEEVVENLKEKGYRIIKEDYPEAKSLTKIRDLVDYFYARRKYYNEDRRFPIGINYKEDTKFISGFLRKRQALGLSRKMAIQEAAVLIDTMFKYEEHLNLKEPIMSPSALQQDFIMNRVCAFANGEVPQINEVITAEKIESINKIYNKEFSERDRELATTRLEKMSRKLDNG